MQKYLIFIKEFLGLDNDYEALLENQELNLESESEKSYSDYLTLKNALLLLLFLRWRRFRVFIHFIK
uniref:Orf66 n=1 Tax=Peronospora tabacina TaxID=230439 RepID=A0A0P0HKL1_9STRA|nr:orf66 [Peronospora tabacina]ALJ78458.1 orf66 [Peronospora tabacina]ALJ78505.1 orf66 [Peronospora tabacina]